MTLEEKVGQLFFVRCPEEEALGETLALRPAGFLLFSRDFEGQTKDSVRDTIATYQQGSEIPMLMGVDEKVHGRPGEQIRSFPPLAVPIAAGTV